MDDEREFEGVVDRVVQRAKNYGILVRDGTGDSEWHNGFGECPVKDGDRVIGTEEKNGDYWNVVGIKQTGKTTASRKHETAAREVSEFVPGDQYHNTRERSIIRQVAFKGAIELLCRRIEKGAEAFSHEGEMEAVRLKTDALEKIILGIENDTNSE